MESVERDIVIEIAKQLFVKWVADGNLENAAKDARLCFKLAEVYAKEQINYCKFEEALEETNVLKRLADS